MTRHSRTVTTRERNGSGGPGVFRTVGAGWVSVSPIIHKPGFRRNQSYCRSIFPRFYSALLRQSWACAYSGGVISIAPPSAPPAATTSAPLRRRGNAPSAALRAPPRPPSKGRRSTLSVRRSHLQRPPDRTGLPSPPHPPPTTGTQLSTRPAHFYLRLKSPFPLPSPQPMMIPHSPLPPVVSY